MALQTKTFTEVDIVSNKIETYATQLIDLYEKLANDPNYQLVQNTNEQRNLVTAAIQHIQVADVMSFSLNLPKGKRFKASDYNAIIDNTKIDLLAAYLRLKNLFTIINGISNAINGRTYNILSQIDEMLDKVANLANLKTTYSQFDKVEYDTFVNNTNTATDTGFKAEHSDSGGMITIRDTYRDLIVDSRDNYNIYVLPLHENVIVRNHNNNATASNMTDAMDTSIYSYNNLYLDQYEVGIDNSGNAVSMSYNGAVCAIIFHLPSVKFINSISMKFASAGLTEIVDVYYSPLGATNITSFSWNQVPFTIDKNNVRGTTINCPTIDAGSVMVILGQKTVRKITTSQNRGLKSLIGKNVLNFNDIIKELENNINVVTKNKLLEYASPNVVAKLSNQTAMIVNTLITQLEDMLPEEDKENQDISAPTNLTEIYEYNFSIYDLKIQYIHFYNNSTFKSKYYGGQGKISDIMLTSTGNVPSGTRINYYIELQNGQHRIIPNNETSTTDIFTVLDTDIKSYNTDLLMNAPISDSELESVVSVTINGTTLEHYDGDLAIYQWQPIKVHSMSTVGFGITIHNDVSIEFGDTITVSYSFPSQDVAGATYNANVISIDTAVGNPVLKNRNLKYGSKSRMLTANQDNGFTSYSIPTEAWEAFYPVSGATEDAQQAFEILSGELKDNFTVFPQYAISDVGYAISGQYGRIGTGNLYYGIIDEQHTISSNPDGDTVLNTDYEYIPGTLHIESQGMIFANTEYDTDTISVKYDKTEFTTAGIPVSGDILCSYMPANFSLEIQEDNVAEPNYRQLYPGTDVSSAITLDHIPYVDAYILASSLHAGSEWIFSQGKFINKNNERIVYAPISILLNGKPIVNMTNYQTSHDPDIEDFEYRGNNPMYYVKGRKVIFNTYIDTSIEVRYYYLNDKFKLVAKLYRTNRSVDDITPEMYGFALYLNERDI